MTHNVTLPLRSCLHTTLREREREGEGETGEKKRGVKRDREREGEMGRGGMEEDGAQKGAKWAGGSGSCKGARGGCGIKVAMESEEKGGGKTRVGGSCSCTGERKQSAKGVNSRRQRGRSR